MHWYRPVTLSQLLKLRDKFPHHHNRNKPQHRIVVGNTEIGVEVGLKGAHYSVLIAPSLVPELRVMEVTNDGLLVGAAVTLTDLKTKLTGLTSSLPGTCMCVLTIHVNVLYICMLLVSVLIWCMYMYGTCSSVVKVTSDHPIVMIYKMCQ